MTQHVSHYHSDQIRELHAEIERLTERRGGEATTAIAAQAEIERLTALVAQQSRKHDADVQAMQLEIDRLAKMNSYLPFLIDQRDRLRAALAGHHRD